MRIILQSIVVMILGLILAYLLNQSWFVGIVVGYLVALGFLFLSVDEDEENEL